MDEEANEVKPDNESAELKKQIASKNLCDIYEDRLPELGAKLAEWFDEDEASRQDWRKRNDSWMKLATQVVEVKTYPWPNAANVKYPLLTTAAMQFAARAYPALVPGPNLVQGMVLGEDSQGLKQQAAKRIGAHMSYQLLNEMENWEEEMDKLCLMLPIVGCLFKKTYYDPTKQINCSELISPNDLVIDYYAKSVDDASRISHIIYRTKNEVEERIRRGIFKDVALGEPRASGNAEEVKNKINGTQEPKVTPATPYKFIEMHTWWDLDDDGYEEPYIITVHYDTKQVVRIVTRFDEEGIKTEVDEKTGKQKLVAIKPTQYFTKFGFIPNPDGSIYDLGFGLLLGGINESVNTLTNQLLDSGTLNNLSAGFLGRGIRVRSGGSRFVPGEWKPVDFTGDDIKKHIFPLPTKEPSEVLFKLLEALVTSGKELASVAEIFVGKMPGQNTPATTTMATIEQGLKVFTAIHKRIYRSLSKEYQKLFALNGVYMDEEVFFTINEPQGPQGQQAYRTDYAMKIAVKPNSDPNIVSSAQKLMKVQSFGPLLQLKTINPQEYTKRFLEAVEAENIAALMQVQPQPDPEAQKAQAEMMLKQQDAQMKAQLEQMKAAYDQKSKEMDLRFKQAELELKMKEAQLDMMVKQRESDQKMVMDQRQMQMDMHAQNQTHQLKQKEFQQKSQQSDQNHQLKMKQQKQQADLKAKAKPNGANK
jgi:chaperonin GroES